MPHGTPRLVSIDDAQDFLIEPVIGRPQLVSPAAATSRSRSRVRRSLLDFDVTILEDRPEFAQPAAIRRRDSRFDGDVPDGDRLAATTAGRSFIVIATRGHKLDADCVLAAVEDKRAGTSVCSAAGARPSSSPICSANTASPTIAFARSTRRSGSISGAGRRLRSRCRSWRRLLNSGTRARGSRLSDVGSRRRVPGFRGSRFSEFGCGFHGPRPEPEPTRTRTRTGNLEPGTPEPATVDVLSNHVRTLIRISASALRLLLKDRSFTLDRAADAGHLHRRQHRDLQHRPVGALASRCRCPNSDRIVFVYNSYPNAGAPRASDGRAGLLRSAARDDGLRGAGDVPAHGLTLGSEGGADRLSRCARDAVVLPARRGRARAGPDLHRGGRRRGQGQVGAC